jgi:hypothetical protein
VPECPGHTSTGICHAPSWNEIKSRALSFSRVWDDAADEASQAKPFWIGTGFDTRIVLLQGNQPTFLNNSFEHK